MKFNLWTAVLLQLFTKISYISGVDPHAVSSISKTKSHSSTFVNSTTQTAAYLDIGCGRPLWMLHGFFGEKTCWLPLIELLQSQFRCISLDMLGFAESTKPEIGYDVAVEVDFVRQVVEQLHIEPCCIIGHSFGGWVASAYSLKYPNSVSSLVLAAPAGILDDSCCGQYDALGLLL
ncbi:alpha/beta hydrolase [Microcoleus sp. Pol11C1]|uniref:alpha/beta hydrolase n=1 Tax=unclassified Microcoleus TaxID=2642155 RepID=UPI002FD319CC